MVAILKISKFQVANYLFLCQLYRSTIVRNFMLVSQFALFSQKIEFIRPTILSQFCRDGMGSFNKLVNNFSITQIIILKMAGAASSVTHLVLTCNIILFTLLLLLLCVATCIVSVCATIFQILHSIRK